MTELLLDFRWDVLSLLDHAHDAAEAFTNLVNLCEITGLSGAPFIEPDDQARLYEAIGQARRNAVQFIQRNLEHFVRRRTQTCKASPQPVPGGEAISDSWKRSLYDQLGNPEDWRTPHLLVTRKLRAEWPGGEEVDIYRERCGDEQAIGPLPRVIAALEDYQHHRHSLGDNDPWRNLEHRNPPGSNPRVQFPCWLPKPPNVEAKHCGVQMAAQIAQAQAAGWHLNDRYYYVPPQNYDLLQVDKASWRNGRAFPLQQIDNHRQGPVDFEGRVWLWHGQHNSGEGERHWDVQLADGRHMRITHEGRLLP